MPVPKPLIFRPRCLAWSLAEPRLGLRPKRGSRMGAGEPAPPSYRPDIDILRAIAVLSVLCFHWDIPPFLGGFVGVDVFFVISGFLITQLIFHEIQAGKFSFARFYERRIRRILPALYAVIAVTGFAAWYLLLPPQFIDFARSIIAVTLFSSNILFWQEAGYFDAPALTKPLLHTWSLSVEEQFYLIFPALLVVLFKRSTNSVATRNSVAAILVLAGSSFAYNTWQLNVAPSSAFYLSPGRAWEFLMGSLLAVGNIPTIRTRFVEFSVASIGIAMIITAAVRFTSKTPFPGMSALLPCVGTVLCIWANTNRNPGRIERALTRVPIFYGKISYSLYLWHWPIWLFARLWLRPDGDFPATTKLAIFALASALSFVTFRLVEQPFRKFNMVGRRLLFVSGGIASASLLLVGIAGVELGGFPSRIPPEVAALANYALYPRSGPYRENVCFLQPFQKIAEYDVDKCATPKVGMRNVLLLGDSLAAQYLPGLQQVTINRHVVILQANSASCAPFIGLSQAALPSCDAMNLLVRNLLNKSQLDVVILSANWTVYSEILGYDRFLALLRKTIAEVPRDVRIILFGPSIQYEEALPQLLASFALRSINQLDLPRLVKSAIFDLDRRMKADFAATPNLNYVSILTANCPDQRCPMMIGKIPMQWDAVHLTVPGSEQVIQAALPQMAPALFGP
jgi:peptidoglycan/LPS O-acetylase OafA/YrhL